MRRQVMVGAGVTLLLAGWATACGAHERPRHAASRDITITTVPLLVKEAKSVYPFLATAFDSGGVLDGKEVYAFSPSTITAYAGDTLHLHFVNPEDDEHSFVLPNFAVSLPGGKRVDTTYIAPSAGIYPFVCSIPAHMPMMSGQLVVLP